MTDKNEEFQKLREECLKCENCGLCKTRTNVVFGVGSDLSKENVAFLKQGVFNNLIQKNPYAQGYLGVKNLVEYLMLGRQPEPDKLYVGSEVVFRSNLSMYLNKSYRSLLR